MVSTGTAGHEPAVVFTSPDVLAPAPHRAAAATASAVAFEIKIRNAASVGSDAGCTEMRSFSSHSSLLERATPVTTTSHDITTPWPRKPLHPSMPPPLPPCPPPVKRGVGSCLLLAPPLGDGLATSRGARAFWSGHGSDGGGNARRTGSAHRGKTGRLPEENKAAIK